MGTNLLFNDPLSTIDDPPFQAFSLDILAAKFGSNSLNSPKAVILKRNFN